jgi:hypothetical protein
MVEGEESSVDPRVIEALKEVGVSDIQLDQLREKLVVTAKAPSDTVTVDTAIIPDNGSEEATATEVSKDGTPAAKPSSTTPQTNQVTLDQINELLAKQARQFQSTTDKSVSSLRKTIESITSKNSALETMLEDMQAESTINALPPEQQMAARLQRMEQKLRNPKPSPITALATTQPSPDNGDQTPVTASNSPNLKAVLDDYVTAHGLDPNDPKLDWANEPGVDFNTGFTRLKSSIKKITERQSQEKASAEKTKAGLHKTGNSGASGSPHSAIDKMTPEQKIEYGMNNPKAKK